MDTRPPSPWRRADSVAGVATAALVSLFGAPVGLVWAALAPRALAVRVEGGGYPVQATTKAFIGADAYFLLVTAAVGVLTGVLAFWLARDRQPGVASGLVVGGGAAAVVAAQVGKRLHYAAFKAAPIGAHVPAYVSVRADGVLLAWPMAAVVVFAALVLWSSRASSQPVSWGGPPAG